MSPQEEAASMLESERYSAENAPRAYALMMAVSNALYGETALPVTHILRRLLEDVLMARGNWPRREFSEDDEAFVLDILWAALMEHERETRGSTC